MARNSENNLVIIQLSEGRLSELLEKASRVGALETLRQLGQVKDEYSRSEMYRLFGKGRIDSLISSGRLKPVRVGSSGRCFYSRIDYENCI